MRQIAILHGSGSAGLDRLEDQVNIWLRDSPEAEVISITPTMCTVGPLEDQYQCMAITIVYEDGQ
mgnify:CR=1 FL=1